MIGRVVSRYRIVERLGQGGMGVVYKALDTRLERFAALKFLSAGICDNETIRQRFVQEARAASALDHPNICTIYGIEDTDDGQIFIAMAYYEGENLGQHLLRGQMSVKEAVDITIQAGQALAKAHEHGIVHRDVKPGNLMVTRDGTVKLLDFGLALLGESVRTTQPGIAVGTPVYMSPEQFRGDDCDGRSDVWSLGAMLYEMLTGELPFPGSNHHTLMNAILTWDPTPPSRLRVDVPAGIDAIVARAMEKDRERRYRTALELVSQLRAYERAQAHPDTSETIAFNVSPIAVPAGGTTRLSGSRSALSVVVLPFANLSSDPENEYFSDGITEDLITDLAQIDGIKVMSRTSAFQFKGKTADVRKIGQELRVNSILEGSVRKAGDRLRITAQLVNVSDGLQVWSQRFDRRMEDIFAIQDEIVHSIVSALRARLSGGAQETVAVRRHPVNVEAYNLYLKGRHYYKRQTPDGLAKAVELFEQAIAEDPNFAPPWAGLADYYAAVGFWSVMPPEEVWPKARKHAQRAVELDPDLAHAQTALGYVRIFCDWDWLEAGRNFRKAVELAPGDSLPAYANAVYLIQMNRGDDSLAEFKRALELDPLAMNVNTALAMAYYYRREYDKAIAQAKKTLELDPNYFEMRAGLGLMCLQTGNFEDGLGHLEAVRDVSGDNPLILGMLGHGYGVAGARDRAQEVLARLNALSANQYVAPISLALVYTGLGDLEAAFAWLDKAAAAHDALLCYLDVMPCYDLLRHDPRFQVLRKRIGLISNPTVV
ncbi:MAG TPA: protein kinase [Bryobacteraceae bacterium]|jgi:serine/threonine-protein kinase|nr:protein kinase [Bryobacteraceae bacterium]